MKKATAVTATVAVALVTLMAISAFAVAPVAAQAPSGVNFAFTSPVGDRNVFYGGSVMSVKFTLTDSNGNFITDATAKIQVQTGLVNPTIEDGTPTGQKNTGNEFALDGHTYTYKLNTKPLDAGPGSQPHIIIVTVTLADGTVFTEETSIFSLH